MSVSEIRESYWEHLPEGMQEAFLVFYDGFPQCPFQGMDCITSGH
jgi:hypothetical protein